jgi:hypothetical protein
MTRASSGDSSPYAKYPYLVTFAIRVIYCITSISSYRDSDCEAAVTERR